MALERIGVARLSLPIVKDGRPDVYVAFVFRKFKAGHEARTTDERFSRILFHAVVGGRRVVDAFLNFPRKLHSSPMGTRETS